MGGWELAMVHSQEDGRMGGWALACSQPGGWELAMVHSLRCLANDPEPYTSGYSPPCLANTLKLETYNVNPAYRILQINTLPLGFLGFALRLFSNVFHHQSTFLALGFLFYTLPHAHTTLHPCSLASLGARSGLKP
jgi:hypothetical protein